MKNNLLNKFNKKLLTASILSAALLGQTQAAPIVAGSVLGIDQGVGSAANQPCATGSCFGMEVAPGFVEWTDFGSGIDDGIIVGKNQASGGQENQATPTNIPAFSAPGEVTNAWEFFSNYGTFLTPQGATNIFADTSCSLGSCGGKTELNSWDMAWNGNIVPMGSANGCQSSVCLQNTTKFFDADYTIVLDANGVGPYSLRYEGVIPDGEPTGFGNVIFSLILRGTAVSSALSIPAHSPTPVPLPDGTLLSIGKGSGSSRVNNSCVTGSCFGMTVAPDFIAWTDFGPGTDGGIVVGKNQVNGGQVLLPSSKTNTTPGEMTNAWYFFGNWGTSFTPQGATNIFNELPCTGAACIGLTELRSWNWAWNGNSIPLGSANGCLSAQCTSDQLAGIFVSDWVVNNADSTYRLNYGSIVPDGNPSGFGNVPFTLILRGVIVPDGSTLLEANFNRSVGIVVNQSVQFTDTSRFIGSGISTASLVSWLWDFGDGHTSAQQNPVHTYTQVNDYTVTLTVKDDQANVDTLIQVIAVKPIPSPTPTPTPTITPSPSPSPMPSPTPSPMPPISAAAPIPAGSTLSIEPGVGSRANTACTVGSCFAMEVALGIVVWIDVGPGTDGGFIVGKNQASGGQELGPSVTNTTSGELTAAWNFFSNFGTFYTPDATLNVFDNASCAGPACIGRTALGSYNIAWNGNNVPMGGAAGCNSGACSPEELAGDFITNYTIGSYGGPWSILFHNVVPNGSSSGFGNVKFQMLVRGVATLATSTFTPTPTFIPTAVPSPTFTPATAPTPIFTPTPTIAPITNDCTDLFPSVDMMLDGKGHETAAVESTLSVTFSGHIVSVKDAGKKIKICPGTELAYATTSTTGEVKCAIHHKSANPTGTLSHKDKLTCTNKPVGDDTDRFKVKRAKKKDYLPGSTGEDPVKKSRGWHH